MRREPTRRGPCSGKVSNSNRFGLFHRSGAIETLGRPRTVRDVASRRGRRATAQRFAVKRWAAVCGRPSASTAGSTAPGQRARAPTDRDRLPWLLWRDRLPSRCPFCLRSPIQDPATTNFTTEANSRRRVPNPVTKNKSVERLAVQRRAPQATVRCNGLFDGSSFGNPHDEKPRSSAVSSVHLATPSMRSSFPPSRLQQNPGTRMCFLAAPAPR
jgi:hypothetical protein